MNAHQLDANGVILNTIVVDSLNVFPNLIDALVGGSAGDTWNGTAIVKKPRDVEAEKVSVRNQRDLLLAATDWTQLPDVPQTTKDKWVTHRKALRDVPQQAGFPFNVIWPT
jgi:hypothetical protein